VRRRREHRQFQGQRRTAAAAAQARAPSGLARGAMTSYRSILPLMYRFDRKFVADLIAIEREFPAITGSRLSWPKPINRRRKRASAALKRPNRAGAST